MHFIPTYSSWLNQVVHCFGLITDRAIRRGSFSSERELITKIDTFVKAWKDDSGPFIWYAAADSIIEEISRSGAPITGTWY